MFLLQKRSIYAGTVLSSELLFDLANQQGSLIVVGVVWGDNITTCTVTDTNSNVINSVPVYRDTTNISSSQIFYVINSNSGSNKINVTLSGISDLGFSILEFSPTLQIDSLTGYTASNTAGVSSSSNNINTSKNNSLLFGLYGNLVDLGELTNGANFASATEEHYHQHATNYREVFTGGTYNITWGHPSSNKGMSYFALFGGNMVLHNASRKSRGASSKMRRFF